MDEDIEMITDWPVKDYYHQEDDSRLPQSIPISEISHHLISGSRTSKLSPIVRSGKRQHQDHFANSTIGDGDGCPNKKNLKGSGCASSSFSESNHEDVSSDMKAKTLQMMTAESDTKTPFVFKELLARPRIARWWRRQGQHLVEFEQREKTLSLPNTTNPNTLLFHVARLPQGQSFLKEEVRQLRKRLDGGDATPDLLVALGSLLEWLERPEEAAHYVKLGLQTEPYNQEWQWLFHKIQRQIKIKQMQARLMRTVSSHLVFPAAEQVERVSCKDLNFVEFFHKYAVRKKPVIITDMVDTMTTVPWNQEHIRRIAGNCEVRVKQSVPGSVEWAGLEESKSLEVSQFLDNLDTCHDYLFDWSLPLHCPRLAQEITIPRYFAGDFLQRSAPGSLYQDSWPSLFIAPSGVHSGLHVDAFASNFWMALFQGSKRWVFFHEEDAPCLYPIYAHSLDPTFEASVTDPDLDSHPLLSLVHPKECILTAGEILFVPGGCPHYVQNLDTTLAISANFVDLSNFPKVLEELQINALLDPRAADLLHQFRQPSFIRAMNNEMGDLPWTEFKSWPSVDVDRYTLTEETLAQTHR